LLNLSPESLDWKSLARTKLARQRLTGELKRLTGELKRPSPAMARAAAGQAV
jgi:hypothetical protein